MEAAVQKGQNTGQSGLKIAILGTRGIPNMYGGFEQFAEQFSVRLAAKGHQVYVYTTHKHPYKEDSYKGVHLIRCFDPEYKIGTAGQFIYDLNCTLDSRKRNFDIILQLGYTSSTIWSWLFPGRALLVTNMDGLEWSRAKYPKQVQKFLLHAERWGARYSDYLIADSIGIQDYLQKKYQAASTFIPYGAELYEPANREAAALQKFGLAAYSYDLLIARFEPENNIEMALKAYAANAARQLVLIGNYSATGFGRACYEKYKDYPNIRFLGSVYDMPALDELRYYSGLYIHGHSVGGTNPSLLEAMASDALIAAHDNVFNRTVLQEEAFYFKNDAELFAILNQLQDKSAYSGWIEKNRQKIKHQYNWNAITDQMESLFLKWKQAGK